jgi:hypothetical protein
LQSPKITVPGLQLLQEQGLEGKVDVKATSEALDIFTSSPNTVLKLVEVWKKLDNEKFSNLT